MPLEVFNLIIKDDILAAIREIDKDGVRSGRHSTTYNLIYDGRTYPPKYVLSLAARYATGKELEPSAFAGGSETDAFKLLEKFNFEVAPKGNGTTSMTSNDFTKSLFNYLQNLQKGSKMENWIFGGETDIRYSNRDGAWPQAGFLFTNDTYSFIIRSIGDGGINKDLSYLVVESNNLKGQLGNISLYNSDKYKSQNGKTYIFETFDMTIGRGRKPREEVAAAFKRQGFTDNTITTFSTTDFDADKVLSDILRWAAIRENVKKYLQEASIDTLKEPTMPTHKYPKNIILYGPPGTGKTFNSIDKAVEIIMGSSSTHLENKKIFNRLRKEGQIEFVTFHQNYSYEDFIVGLKPDAEFEQLRFKPWKGIFYEMSRRARENYYASSEKRSVAKDFDAAFEEIIKPLSEGREVEIKMKSGIAYSIYGVRSSTILFRKQKGSTIHTLSIDTLKDLVDNTRNMPAGLEPYYTPLVNLIQEKRQENKGVSVESEKNYVLIIDEINRANISRVFGELITLLEEDKRIGQLNELRITLSNGERDFGIPPNLYIIGTMNTADKSIALIDIALRRRFDFIGYYPDYELPELGADEKSLLRHINTNIYKKKKSADYLIGHAYFLNNGSIEGALKNKVIPLLMEYFSGKPEIVTEIFNGSGWQVTYNLETFAWDVQQESPK
jgi:hypothetical protein